MSPASRRRAIPSQTDHNIIIVPALDGLDLSRAAFSEYVVRNRRDTKERKPDSGDATQPDAE